MQIILLGQGYESISKNAVGKQLIKFLSQKDFHTFTGISAFSSQRGIIGLSKYIAQAKQYFKIITIITGVDEKGTSKEALESLIDLNINAYIHYHPSNSIFHPKIYLFEGEQKSELIVGSANLTTRGLFTNIETSLLISIDNKIETDRKIIEELKNYFKGIFDLTDPNLKLLTSKLIAELVNLNIVPTEAERRALYHKEGKTKSSYQKNIILKIFPKREIPKTPNEFSITRDTFKKTRPIIKTYLNISPKGELLWTRKNLPASSVQSASAGTNPTGGLRLVQDNFVLNGAKIDQTSYFRNNIFGNFIWRQIRNSPFVEAATVTFDIVIKGKFIGKYELEIRHKPTGEAGQHNYTTSISWGEISETIRKANLTGKRLGLYAPKGRSKTYHIEIS